MEFILAIDQGTTNTKALLFNRKGQAIFKDSVAVGLLQPKPGYVEQDPLELWQSTCQVTAQPAPLMQSRQAQRSQESPSQTNEKRRLAWRPQTGRLWSGWDACMQRHLVAVPPLRSRSAKNCGMRRIWCSVERACRSTRF